MDNSNLSNIELEQVIRSDLGSKEFDRAKVLVQKILSPQYNHLPFKDFALLKQIREYYLKRSFDDNDPRLREEGIANFMYLLEREPNKDDVLVNLAYLYEYSNKKSKATQSLKKAIELTEDIEKTVSNIVRFYRNIIFRKNKSPLGRAKKMFFDISIPEKDQKRIHQLIEQHLLDIKHYESTQLGNFKTDEEKRQHFQKEISDLKTGLEGKDFKAFDLSLIADYYSLLEKNESAADFYQKAINSMSHSPRQNINVYSKAIDGLARVLVNSNEVEKTISRLLEKMVFESESDELYNYYSIGKIYFKLNDSERAIQYLSRVISFGPMYRTITRIEKYVELTSIGDSYRLLGNLYKKIDPLLALTYYKKAIPFFESFINTHTKFVCERLANCYYEVAKKDSGFMEKALQEAERLIKICQGNAKFWYAGNLLIGDIFLEAGDFEKCKAYYQKCIKQKPKDIAAYDKIVKMHEKKGDYKEAINTVNQILTLPTQKDDQKSYEWNLFRLAELHLLDGNRSKAEELWREIVEDKSPENLTAVKRLLRLYSKQDDFEKYDSLYERRINALKTDVKFNEPSKNNIVFLELIAKYFYDRKKFKRCKRYNNLILEIDPYDAIAITRNANILMFEKKLDEAESEIKKIYNFQEDSIALFYLGEIYLRKGKHADAIHHFTESYFRSGSNSNNRHLAALDKVAQTHKIKGDYTFAIQTYEIIITEQKNDFRALTSMADCYVKRNNKGDKEKAFDNLVKVIKERPRDKVTIVRIVELLKESIDLPNVKTAFKEWIEIQPDNVKKEIIEQITAISTFEQPINKILEELFLTSSHFVRAVITHYFMKQTIYLYIFHDRLSFDSIYDYVNHIFSLLETIEDEDILDLVSEYFASSKGAYLEFSIAQFQPILNNIQQEIESCLVNTNHLIQLKKEINIFLNERDKFRKKEYALSFEQIDLIQQLNYKVRSYRKNIPNSEIVFNPSTKVYKMDASTYNYFLQSLEEVIENYLIKIFKLSLERRIVFSVNEDEMEGAISLQLHCEFDYESIQKPKISQIEKELKNFITKHNQTSFLCIVIHFDSYEYKINFKCTLPETNEFLKYMISTYENFDAFHKEKDYWKRSKNLFLESFERPVENRDFMTNYLILQMSSLYEHCKKESMLELNISRPYHAMQHKIGDLEKQRDRKGQQEILNELKELAELPQKYFKRFKFPILTVESVTELLSTICDSFNQLYNNESIYFELYFKPTDDYTNEFSKIRMEDCFYCLSKNAVQSIQEKQKRKAKEYVRFSIERAGNFQKIECSDTGIGMNPEDTKNIFQEGQHKSNKEMGSGWGLTIIKEAVDLHDGYIEPSSDGINKGMKFAIYLPIKNYN